MNIIRASEETVNYAIAMRREFHENPELSMQEVRTSRRICEELAKMGIPYERVGLNNVVGCIRSGEGRKIAVRADIDALPVNEEIDLPYKSKIPGKMHACGHDAHAAGLLAVAKMLTEIPELLNGTVYLCFQEAEETGEGADEIVAYLQEKGGVDSCVGMHNASHLEPGVASVTTGPFLAGARIFYITAHGRGGHGSRPDLSIDPISMLVDIYQHITHIPVYEHSLFDDCNVNVCQISSGNRFNVFPDSGTMSGNIRYTRDGDAEILMARVEEVAHRIAELHGGTAEVKFEVAAKYPLINDAEYADQAKKVFAAMGCPIVTDEKIAGSDNFAEFLHAFPGCYVYVGCASERPDASHAHHSVNYDYNEKCMKPTVEFFVNYILADQEK